MFRLDGRIALITGAARGQGAATARLFAAQGATVIVTDILENEGRALAAEIGDKARFLRLDVATEAEWRDAIDRVSAAHGPIGILVNNAAVTCRDPITRIEKGRIDRTFAINLVGPLLGIGAVVPSMIAAGRGSIVNISSVDGLRGTAEISVYAASKWGLRGATKALAVELAPVGIRVNSVHPGAIDTPMLNPSGGDPASIARQFGIGAGRVGRSDEVAAATLFLASDEASYVSGAELLVDAAWSAGGYLGPIPGRQEALDRLAGLTAG